MADRAPRLVLVGERGWENEHIIDLLDRSPRLQKHVVEVSGLPTPSLKRLMGGARALLMPSFGEGYGLPVVEALALGVPVIASDIPVFHEVGGGRIMMIDPTDGPRWREAIRGFSDDASGVRRDALIKLKGYRSPTWPSIWRRSKRFLSISAGGRHRAQFHILTVQNPSSLQSVARKQQNEHCSKRV